MSNKTSVYNFILYMYMALNFLLGGLNYLVKHDSYSPPDQGDSGNACRVRIYCPGKGISISAMLSEGLNISVKSTWKSLFDGAIGGTMGKLIGTIDNIAQGLYGYTIRQPYFGRKYWTGTEPMGFSLTFQFVSFSDAKKEVYDPMVGLLSLLYPRIGGSNAGIFQKYIIPGPNLFYNVVTGAAGNDGDRVEISLGKFLFFKGCYIPSIALHIENSFSTDGYPHCVKVEMSFETMDVAYVNPDGSFMENGFEDASVDLGGSVEMLRGFARGVVDKTSDALKRGGGALSNAFSGVLSKK